MESLAQLNADFWILTAVLLFAFWWVLAVAVIWKMFRAFGDLHDIRESLHWIAHCARAPEQPVQAPKPAAMLSQFGR